MKDDECGIAIFFLVLALVLGAGLYVIVVTLTLENTALKIENNMLKNTLANYGADVEELSTTVDNLRKEQNRGIEWNDNAVQK